jgi:hypothetical protein
LTTTGSSTTAPPASAFSWKANDAPFSIERATTL